MRFKLEGNLGEGWNLVEDCEICGKQKSQCECSKEAILEPKKHRIHFRKEKRNGKIVTVIGEFFLTKKDSKDVLDRLKKSLATGGSIKGGFIEIQGDFIEATKKLLQDFGQK